MLNIFVAEIPLLSPAPTIMYRKIAAFFLLAVAVGVTGLKMGSYTTHKSFTKDGIGSSGILPQPISGMLRHDRDEDQSVVYNDGVLDSPQIALNVSNIIYSSKFGDGQNFSCENGRLVGSINCVMESCTKMIIGCALPVNFKINSLDQIITDEFDDDGKQHVCPPGFFVIGIQCIQSSRRYRKLICAGAYSESGF